MNGHINLFLMGVMFGISTGTMLYIAVISFRVIYKLFK